VGGLSYGNGILEYKICIPKEAFRNTKVVLYNDPFVIQNLYCFPNCKICITERSFRNTTSILRIVHSVVKISLPPQMHLRNPFFVIFPE